MGKIHTQPPRQSSSCAAQTTSKASRESANILSNNSTFECETRLHRHAIAVKYQ